MAEPTKADLEARLRERDAEIAKQKADAQAQIDELKAKLEAQGPSPAVADAPDGGPIMVDLPADRTPIGAEPFNPDKPEVGQYVGHGATSIASSSGTFQVDPATGLIVGRA